MKFLLIASILSSCLADIGFDYTAKISTRPITEAPLVGARLYALDILGYKQFDCLDRLWYAESRWRVTATNKTSGAYGIPQAYPGSKMASEGEDWKTNPMTQIKWGLKYIENRYDTACKAWKFFLNNRWY